MRGGRERREQEKLVITPCSSKHISYSYVVNTQCMFMYTRTLYYYVVNIYCTFCKQAHYFTTSKHVVHVPVKRTLQCTHNACSCRQVHYNTTS